MKRRFSFFVRSENAAPDRDFLQLLEQALGSAQAMTISSSHSFLSALNGTSVYYDFLTPLPLSILADLARRISTTL